MRGIESEGLDNIVEELPPKRQDLNTITIPPKKTRSELQNKWSKTLGQKSQEFKKRKQHLLSGQAPKMTQPIPVNEPAAEPEAAEPAVNKSGNKLWLSVPVTFGIGLLIVWGKWGKYKVFNMSPEPEKPTVPRVGDTKPGASKPGDTKPGDTKPASGIGKCKIIAME